MVWTCRKLQYLSPHQMLTLSFPFFLRYYILKNPAIWLSNSILVHNSRTRILNRNGIGCEISITILIIILDYFQEKLLTKCFKKKHTHTHTKTCHFGFSLPKFGQKWIFLDKRAWSVFKYSNYLPLCKKIRKNQWPIPNKNATLTERQQTVILYYPP